MHRTTICTLPIDLILKLNEQFIAVNDGVSNNTANDANTGPDIRQPPHVVNSPVDLIRTE